MAPKAKSLTGLQAGLETALRALLANPTLVKQLGELAAETKLSITIDQACQMTGLSKTSLTREIDAGRLKAHKLQTGGKNGRLLIWPEDLIEWRNTQQVEW